MTESGKFNRRDVLKGIAAGTALMSAGIPVSGNPATKPGKSRKTRARQAAMNTFTKALWVHIQRSFPGGAGDVPGVLDKWADAGFNLIIPHVRSSTGETLYRRTKHKISADAATWDPVEVLNAEAVKRGMRIHPWCSVFVGAQSDFAREHPEYIGKDSNGKTSGDFLCAAQEPVQDWAFSYFEEMMDNYDIAGIHHDYIRYDDYLCWCDHCRAVFKRETGMEMDKMEKGSPEWARWITGRVHHINRFVKRVQDAATAKDKETSAAVFATYPDCVVSVAQDWLTWAGEQWVDFLLPMNYWGEVNLFNRLADIHLNGVNKQVPVFEGVANHLPTEIFKIDLSAEELLDRSRWVKNAGFQGICYFAAGTLTDDDLKMIRQL